MQEKWAQIQSILEKRLASGQVKALLASLAPVWGEEGLVLCARNEFAATHIRTWYGSHLAQAVSEVCGCDCPVTVVARFRDAAEESQMMSAHAVAAGGKTDATDKEGHLFPTPGEPGVGRPSVPFTAQPIAFLDKTGPLPASGQLSGGALVSLQAQTRPSPRPLPAVQLTLPASEPQKNYTGENSGHWRYSFEDFVVGPCNELAHASARSMCGDSGHSDVLFLSSAPGLGKTHLMHAVGNALCAACNRSQPNVQYLTAEEFASRFYYALKGQDTDRFKARFRTLDLLLLEDVHFLQGKEKMQAELLATVKSLRDRGAKVVFSSSFAPKDLKLMDEQLHSRFSAGLLSCIDRPDEDTRRRILRRKASVHQVVLPEEVEHMLARYIHADVRQIESCLQNLILKARLLNSRITPQMAWEIISHYASHAPVLDMESIVNHVCQAFGLNRDQLVSPSRKQEYVSARNTIFFLARKHTELSLECIGRRFNRKHSTVLKGITALEREISRQSPQGRQISQTLAMIERNGNIVMSAHPTGM